MIHLDETTRIAHRLTDESWADDLIIAEVMAEDKQEGAQCPLWPCSGCEFMHGDCNYVSGKG